MYAAHDAFRRDLRRLAAAEAGRSDDPAVRTGWANLKNQPHIHRTAEGTSHWPTWPCSTRWKPNTPARRSGGARACAEVPSSSPGCSTAPAELTPVIVIAAHAAPGQAQAQRHRCAT
jgi:hypothetical protein